MVTTEIVRYADSISGHEIALSVEEVKRSICDKATDIEATKFIMLCKSQGLNPWVNDAYLIKYDSSRPATMVVGKDAFTKRADAHPHFSGMESGVIILSGDKLERRVGTLVLPEEKIVGAWCKVHRTDRTVPTETTISFDEYNTNQAMWKKMPGTMIEKVAIVRALRTAFPATFSGLYDMAEMGLPLDDTFEPEGLIKLQESKAETFRVASNVDKEFADDIDELISPATPFCEAHSVEFELKTSTSGQSRWCHQLSDGGWCVSADNTQA